MKKISWILPVGIVLVALLVLIFTSFDSVEEEEIQVNIYPENDSPTVSCTEELKLCGDGSRVSRVAPDCEFEKCPDEKRNVYCETEDYSEGCTETYAPVCGWFDSERIHCALYPCAQDFTNGCLACEDEKVDYWTSLWGAL